jgi:hypothetical protein
MQSNNTFPEFSWGVFTWQMLVLISIFLMIYCLTNISKSDLNKSQKLFWILLVILLPIVGPIIYLFKNR